MKNSILTTLLLFCVGLSAQDRPAIESALKTFDDASDVSGMQLAVAEMKAISDKDNNDWYSAYWTAFFYSQTGRLTDNSKTYYDSAQLYFDRAKASNSQPTGVESSDFHALQSLIYGLQASEYWQARDRTNGLKFDGMSNQELNLALKANSKNPRVHLLSATGLIAEGQRVKNNAWILAGRDILQKAKSLYESQKPVSSIAPNWGSGWVNFWLSRAKVD